MNNKDDPVKFELASMPLPIRNVATLAMNAWIKEDLGARMCRALLKDQQELIEAKILQDETRIAAAEDKMRRWAEFAKYLSDEENDDTD